MGGTFPATPRPTRRKRPTPTILSFRFIESACAFEHGAQPTL